MKKNTISKVIVAAAAILFYQTINNGVNAQGLYISAGGGYNLAAGSMTLGSNTTPTSETVIASSLGKGINFGAAFGYMFSANLGAELGVSMLMGSKITSNDASSSDVSTSTIKGKMIRVVPALRITCGEKLKPYAKFGVVMGLSPSADMTGTSTSTNLDYKTSSTSTGKASGGSSIGWMGALGVDFGLSDMISIYLELNSINQSWAPDKETSTSTNTTTITDPFTGLSTTETSSESVTTTYVKTNTDPVPDHQELKQYVPFSSFGVNVGIKLSFGGGAKAAAATK